jgi:transcriptional regulator with XRE-family HTH domain
MTGTPNRNAHGAQSGRANAHVGLEIAPVHPYGTQGAPAQACALGQISGPDGPDAGNGFLAGRAPAHVGLDSPPLGSHPSGSETLANRSPAHGVNLPGAPKRVGPRLDGNTDTRGLVDDAERERLRPFGTEVRAMRKAAGLTQERLGKLAGIGTTHISRLEQGRRRPSVDAIQAVARIIAPEGTADAAEQRLAHLAGDSLRTGAARRKRQRDNKHRIAALREMERANRKLKSIMAGRTSGPDLRGLLDSGEDLAAGMRAELEAEPTGIRGVVPVDEQARRNRYGYSRPRGRSIKDIRAWLAENAMPGDADADEDEDEVS